ncbi:MAG: B12-binding domain-containing radical SAM protein [Nitrospinae bacterium]|nr:B12-binding domain-containing radical SAM protein [Nitrospinota bacterium]
MQTTRGCPLNCSFCSVTAYNGARYRKRPIEQVIEEFKRIPNKHLLIVDDNFIGTRPEHIERAKTLLRAMIQANLGKKWVAQTTINCGDDEEFLELAQKAGCIGFLIGFESNSKEGLVELNKKFSIRSSDKMVATIDRIHKYGISIAGSFIIGLDSDSPGIGRNVSEEAKQLGIDVIVMMLLTPLPGTKVYKKLDEENRLPLKSYPKDWEYYTLKFPVVHFEKFSSIDIMSEMEQAYKSFFSLPSTMYRSFVKDIGNGNKPLFKLLANLSSKRMGQLELIEHQKFTKIYGTIAKSSV